MCHEFKIPSEKPVFNVFQSLLGMKNTRDNFDLSNVEIGYCKGSFKLNDHPMIVNQKKNSPDNSIAISTESG